MSRMCLPQRNNFHTLSTVVVVCGATSRLSARAAIDLPDWLRLSGVSPLPRGASSHALGVAVNALPWFAACAGVLCVSPRMCMPERASSARVCGTRPAVARWLLNAGCLLFPGYSVWPGASSPAPPPDVCRSWRQAAQAPSTPLPCQLRVHRQGRGLSPLFATAACMYISACTYPFACPRPSSCMSMSLMCPYRSTCT